MKRLRIYLDTSVIGGCLDPEFADESNALLALGREGKATLLISELLANELIEAPADVRDILAALPAECIEEIAVTEEAKRLRDDYLRAGVIAPNSSKDALHVALATVWHADLIASWNFKHLVHFQKIRGFSAVNIREGYLEIRIHSPKEIV